ncbi:hypothetical protein B5M47_03925 [candidate division CPR3 bacterium 4484_211]|uniref:Uncharacterized protein n=1 Tax=candidate division CPR3 bacterium 4484_211 TaxID=1968527 RepID=A0A1W9NW28_UNCC3|nr:MAG: hypothetical protein B5M47_03925 [candidate division CPR3 bacterium 4484_211]
MTYQIKFVGKPTCAYGASGNDVINEYIGGGTCGQSNNSKLIIQNPYPICAESDVNGQIERFSCDGLTLDNGIYDLTLVLTEESFHQSSYGTWTNVMSTDISFEIE